MGGIRRERGLKYAPFSYSCFLNGCSSACNIIWAVDLNEKMPVEHGTLWPKVVVSWVRFMKWEI